MSGTLVANSIQPDVGTNLYLDATQGSGNVVFGNTTTSLVSISPTGNLTIRGAISSGSGNLTANNGLYSVNNFNGTFTDGIVMDYVTGNGRISVGTADGLTFYNGGVGSTALMAFDSSGNVGVGITPPTGLSGYSAFNVRGASIQTNNATGTTWFSANIDLNNKYILNGYGAQLGLVNGGMQFLIAPSGTAGNTASFTQAMTLDTSGRLGIGTTSPVTRLQVQDSLAITNGGGGQYLLMGNQDSGGANKPFIILSGNANLQFGVGNSWSSATGGTFTEFGRFDSSGNFLVGATSQTGASEKLLATTSTYTAFVAQNTNASNISDVMQVTASRNTVNGSYRAFTYYNIGAAAYKFIIYDSGSILSVGSYNNTTASGANMTIISDGNILRSTSSSRYKNSITDATHGLAEVLKLRPVTYKGNNDGDTVFGGLIAEEVHDAGLTEFVQYNDDGEPDALSYGNMVSLAFKAIQELTARLEALENKQ